MKRIVCAALLLSLALFPVFAGEPEPAFEIQEGAELTIWADETRAPILEALGAQFTEEYGVPVVVQQLGFGDIRDNLKVAGPAGEGPDIMIGAHDWLGELSASGLVAPIDLGSKRSDFTDASIAGFTYDGQLYGMPYAVENLAFVYNADLISEAPSDWDEVRDLAISLKDAGSVSYGYAIQENDPYHFFPLQTSFGGYVFGVNNDGTYNADDVGIDSSGSIAALSWLENMVEEGNSPQGLDYGSMHAMFFEGETAMIITGPWALGDIRNSGINYAIAPIPGGGKPFLGVQGFMVSQFSENVPMAQAFLTEFVAQTEPMFTLFEEGGRPPAYIPALEMVEDEDLAGYGAAGREGLPMPAIPEMSAVWGSWGDAVALVVQGQISADEAFQNAATQIRNTIAGN